MTPDQEQRLERLQQTLARFSRDGLAQSAYAIACDIEALTVAALAVRLFWADRIAAEGVTPETAAISLEAISAAARAGGLASAAMASLEPLFREESMQHLGGTISWIASGESAWGSDALDGVCSRIVEMTPDLTASIRATLQRLYDNPQGGGE
jgi:hypothetical protein